MSPNHQSGILIGSIVSSTHDKTKTRALSAPCIPRMIQSQTLTITDLVQPHPRILPLNRIQQHVNKPVPMTLLIGGG